jgi:hypothetical protein
MSEDMSGQSGHTPSGLSVATVVCAVLAGGALFGIASALVVVVRPHNVLLDAGLSVAVALGYALIALWLCLVLRRRGGIGGSGEGNDGADWDGGPRDPNAPQLPTDGPDLWPELEREVRAYLEAQERTPVSG